MGVGTDSQIFMTVCVCVHCRDCVFDLCAEQGSEVLRCENYAVYARACQDQGVQIKQWRQELKCGMTKKEIINKSVAHTTFPKSLGSVRFFSQRN